MKFLSRLSAAVLSVTLFTASTLAHAEYVSIARDDASFRAGPGTNHAIEWTLAKGYPLKVVDRKGKWFKVQDFEKDSGWVHQSVTNKTRHHIVSSRTVNLREKPNANAKVLGQAHYGDVLRGLDQSKGWVKVRTESGLVAWASDKLVWGR